MKKKILLVSIIILMVLTSCTGNEFEPKDMIRKPEITISPIKGKWSIEGLIDEPYKSLDEKEKINTKIEALFHKEGVVLGEDFVVEPSYKIRNVNLEDYLFYNYKIDSDYLGIKEEEAEVITVLGQGQYFYEFIRYKEDKMFYYDNNQFIFLNRKVEEVSSEEINRYISIEKSIRRISNNKEIDTLNSGFLLGIKTKYMDEESGMENWDYKTIWIKSNNRTIGDVYKIDGLLVPRKKGFYLVDVKRKENDSNINDSIEVSSKAKSEEEFLEEDIGKESSTLKHIVYIGNDYVSTEEIDLETKKKTLRVYPIDYLEDNKSMKISNFMGGNILDLFYQSAKDTIKVDTNHILEEESFGFERRNGHWVMRGRVNYKNQGEEYFKDFPIKANLPKELVYYDELIIPWNKIKARIPETIDAFTSPNEDIIIIVTRNNILLYPIVEDDISLNELGRIEIGNQETIVMAEWALGQNTALWEEEFLKNGAEKVKDK